MSAVASKTSILTGREMDLALRRMASEIAERSGRDVVLAGVRTRGEPLALRLAALIEEMEGFRPPVGVLDIGIHRDDLDIHPYSGMRWGPTRFDTDITDRHVVLVDDVFFTGRTVRAALDALMELGRPRRIWFAALIDRGHRELPFRPDFVGKHVPTARAERVNVRLKETDGEEGVWLERPADAKD